MAGEFNFYHEIALNKGGVSFVGAELLPFTIIF